MAEGHKFFIFLLHFFLKKIYGKHGNEMNNILLCKCIFFILILNKIVFFVSFNFLMFYCALLIWQAQDKERKMYFKCNSIKCFSIFFSSLNLWPFLFCLSFRNFQYNHSFYDWLRRCLSLLKIVLI